MEKIFIMDRISKVFTIHKEDDKERLANDAYSECSAYSASISQCRKNMKESHNVDCFEEELAEKKCLASRLCPELYKKFYEYSECHLWAAAFRRKDDQRYIQARARIDNNRTMSKMCRELGHELTRELSNYSKYRPEASEGESWIKENVGKTI